MRLQAGGWLLLLCAAGLAAVGSAQHGSSCGPKISFFPHGGEDRNIPSAWGRTAQLAAGNAVLDEMFTIVLNSNNNLPGIAAGAVPVLHVQPLHPLLAVGSSGLPAACTGFEPKVRAPQPDAGAAAAAPVPPPPATEQQQQAAAVAPKAEAAAPPAASKRAAARKGDAVETATDEAAVLPAGAPAEKLAALNATATAAVAAGDSKAAQPAVKDLGPATRHLLSPVQEQQGDASAWGDGWQQAGGGEQLAGGGGRRLLEESVTVPARYRLSYWMNDTQPVEAGEFNMYTPVQRITLSGLASYPDGYYCLFVKVTIVQQSGLMAGYIAVPPVDLWSVRQVCFYKMDNRPTVRAEFATCSDSLRIAFKDIQPQPVPLYPGSTRSLFHSVFQFNANLNRTKDWSWPSDATPKSLTHWMVMGAGDSVAKSQVYVPDDRVAEGWYNLRLEASITTDFPSLLGLASPVVGKYEDASTPSQLAEKPKLLATAQPQNGTVQGIQWTPTEFKSLTGPEDEVRYAVNDEMQLSWEFEGFGETFCFLDGKLFHNSGEFGCRPPLNVQLPDRHNHTLRVIMQDVCNATFVADAVYGLFGYKLVRAPKAAPKPADSASHLFVDSGQKYELGTTASSTLRAPRATTARTSVNAAGAPAAHTVTRWLLAAAVGTWWLLAA